MRSRGKPGMTALPYLFRRGSRFLLCKNLLPLTHIKSNRHPRESGDLHIYDPLFCVIPGLTWDLLMDNHTDCFCKLDQGSQYVNTISPDLIWDLIMNPTLTIFVCLTRDLITSHLFPALGTSQIE